MFNKGCYRFSIVFAFLWTGENDSNTPRVDAYYFKNGEKNLRVQKYPGTCEQGGVRSGDATAARTLKKQ